MQENNFIFPNFPVVLLMMDRGIKGVKCKYGDLIVSQNENLRLTLFDHLPRCKQPSLDKIDDDRCLHHATVQLCGLYYSGVFLDDDQRIESLIVLLLQLIHDYKTPPKKLLREDLDRFISKQVW